MPRQSRSRPTVSRSTSAPAQPPSRSAATATAPGYAPQPAPPVPAAANSAPARQPGMLAQMAATAGSVAVGSTVGHGISSMLFGGGGSAPAPVAEQQAPAAQQTSPAGANCDFQAKEFKGCLENANFNSCSWYFEQLKACQAAAAPY